MLSGSKIEFGPLGWPKVDFKTISGKFAHPLGTLFSRLRGMFSFFEGVGTSKLWFLFAVLFLYHFLRRFVVSFWAGLDTENMRFAL